MLNVKKLIHIAP